MANNYNKGRFKAITVTLVIILIVVVVINLYLYFSSKYSWSEKKQNITPKRDVIETT